MNAVEKLEAAIERLERLKRESDDDTVAPQWENRYGPGGDHTIFAHYRVADEEMTQPVAESVYSEDAELIVTLHRTIDAQIRLLQVNLDWHAEEYVSSIGQAELALAEAILGSDA